MNKHNVQVIEALNRYIGYKQEAFPAPKYAVMLKGTWGSGKTYFVREKWLRQIEDDESYSIINVSLFGLKSIGELKNEIAHSKVIFEEIIEKSETGKVIFGRFNRLKKSNAGKGIGSVLNKIMESKLGIGYRDFSSIFLRDWMSEDNGLTKVLILDDLERMKMDLVEVFGYLSTYLESTNLRVIFVCNDDEISKVNKSKILEEIEVEERTIDGNEDESNIFMSEPKQKYGVTKNKKSIYTVKEEINEDDYERIREKIIGETLIIHPDYDDAISDFLYEMNYSSDDKEIIVSFLSEVIEKLKINNLRIIRQTLIKLKPLYEAININKAYLNYAHEYIEISGTKYKKSYYREIVCKFFIFMNIKKLEGELEPDKIGIDSVMKGYSVFRPLLQTGCDKSFWFSYIWNGELDKTILESGIEADMESLIPNEIIDTDIVYKLQIGYWDYSKEEFYSLQERLISQLGKGEITDISALIQAYCLLVSFENNGILDGSTEIDELFDNVLEKVLITASSGDSRRIIELENLDIEFGGYRGYSFSYSSDEQRVRKFIDKLKIHYLESNKIIASIDTKDVVSEILSGRQKLDSLLSNLKEYQPILSYIGIDELWEVLCLTSFEEQRNFWGRLRRRYGLRVTGMEDAYLVYEPDLPVISQIAKRYSDMLDDAIKERDNKIQMYRILAELTQNITDEFMKKIEVGKEIRLVKEQKKKK